MKLRIAILASNLIRLPPEPQYIPKGWSGAPEKVMSIITEKIVEKGHDVSLFASGDSKTSYGTVALSFWTAGSAKMWPMKRLMPNTVFLGLVTAWRRASSPTRRSPVLETATMDGVVRAPSAFSNIFG